MRSIKIGDIECRKYATTKVDKLFYEIIKWEDNHYYNKMEGLIKEGYEESFSGEFLIKNGIYKVLVVEYVN